MGPPALHLLQPPLCTSSPDGEVTPFRCSSCTAPTNVTIRVSSIPS